MKSWAPRSAYVVALAGAAVLTVRLNWPGHYSWDSISALHEGRFHARETWNPAIFGWLLGLLDRVTPNASGFLVLSAALLFGSWAALSALRPRMSWLAVPAALAISALPQAVIYPTIVWKDVLFTETAVAGFVVLALGLKAGQRPPSVALLVSGVLFAAAGLLRQNGLILAVAATAAIGWAGARMGLRKSLVVAGGWLGAVAALTLLFSATLRPQGPGAPDPAGVRGLRLVQAYDLVASLAFRPGRPLPAIDSAQPQAARVIHARGPAAYSPERIDTLSFDPEVDAALGKIPSPLIRTEWLRLLTEDPVLYLRVRAAAFHQVLGTPVIDHCLPVEVGIEGPDKLLRDLRMKPRSGRADQRLYNYVTWFLDTPAMSHLAYGAIAALSAVVLLVRRDPADIIIAALLAGALVFTASFFVISIACDYRYLYLLDVAALTGALYLAVDPTLRRSR